MRWLLIPLLVLHGLIHLLGFSLAWGGAATGRAEGTIIPLGDLALRVAGVAWLIACLALLGTAFGIALGREWWRPLALAALALSQVLIVCWWADARTGTLANLLLLAVLVWRPGLVVWRVELRADARA